MVIGENHHEFGTAVGKEAVLRELTEKLNSQQADALDANRWRELLNFVRYVDYSMERQEVKIVFDMVRGKKLATITDEAIAATKEQPK